MRVAFHRINSRQMSISIQEDYPMTQQGAGATHTPNPQYDLASVLYHALKGAQTSDTYIKDAEQEGDQELAQFFRQVQQEDRMQANKAKELLARRVKVQ
jgi:hypothetical protein